MKKIFFSLLLVLCLFGISACKKEDKGFMFTSYNEGYSVKCIANKSEIIIPSTHKKKPVIKIDKIYRSSEKVDNINIVIPNTVKEIKKYAFEHLTIEKINIPESVTTIGDWAFSACNYLKDVTLPDSITDFGEYVFANCIQLETITLPKNLKVLPRGTFLYCNRLENVILPNGLETIGDGAFGNCPFLTDLTIPSSVKLIDQYAFASSGIKNVILPKDIEYIKQNAFANCWIYVLFIPKSIKEIDKDTFYNASLKDQCFYEGNIDDFDKLIKDSFIKEKTYYYLETEPTIDGNFWHYDSDGITPIIWKK